VGHLLVTAITTEARRLFLAIALASIPVWVQAQDQVVTIQATPQTLPDKIKNELSSATLRLDQIPDVLNTTLGTQTSLSVGAPDFYCIIHILKWSVSDPTKIDTQNWYLYHPGDTLHPWKDADFKAFRIYGSHNVALLYIQLNHLRTNKIVYKVEVTKKLPAPVQNLLMLLQIPRAAVPSVEDVWGGQVFSIDYVPSDVAVRSMVPGSDGETLQEMAKQTYDDEGRYYWDVSISVPVKSINELQYNSENGTVTSTQISRQNIYAFLNIFPIPVDTKGTHFVYPQFLVGLPLSGKPLDRPFVGGGWGLNKVQVFAGVVFNKVSVPSQSPSTTLQTRRQAKLMFGLNVPVRQIVDTLKSKK
jgi:hypothetical protein